MMRPDPEEPTSLLRYLRTPSTSSQGRRRFLRRSQSNQKPSEELPDDERVTELNEDLAMLAEVFPDVQIEVFREMLSSLSDESRRHVVTEALLRHKKEWVKGRWKTGSNESPSSSQQAGQQDSTGASIAVQDQFRRTSYTAAVLRTFKLEFRGLSESSIKAVLAEHNYSYTDARPTLLVLSSRSWRSAISSFFRRKTPLGKGSPESHPCVRRITDSSLAIEPTGSDELDVELHQLLIAQIQQAERSAQVQSDYRYATELNDGQAEQLGYQYECECCFTSVAFEHISTCGESAHYTCHTCVRATVNEALFGQNWKRVMDPKTSSLRCMALSSTKCMGTIGMDHIRCAFDDQRVATQICDQLDARFAAESLTQSHFALVRCPFCPYVEIDEITFKIVEGDRDARFAKAKNSWKFCLLYIILLLSMPLWIITLYFCPAFSQHHLQESLERVVKRTRNRKFTCQSPTCGRISCLICLKAWRDPHQCFKSEKVRYDAFMENALSAALKRTCPQCSVSFIKSSGCNRLVCPCGYKMCYICRVELSGPIANYEHFCEHFRPRAGGCEKCNKCDLYKSEDDQIVLARAKEEAERVWVETEGISPQQMQQGTLKVWTVDGILDQFMEVFICLPPWGNPIEILHSIRKDGRHHG